MFRHAVNNLHGWDLPDVKVKPGGVRLRGLRGLSATSLGGLANRSTTGYYACRIEVVRDTKRTYYLN